MAKVKIDNVEYETNDLPEETQALLASIQFVEAEALRCRNQIAVLQTARTSYMNSLRDALPNDRKKKSSAKK